MAVAYGSGLALTACLIVAVTMSRCRAGAARVPRIVRWWTARRQRRVIRHLDRSLRPDRESRRDPELLHGLAALDVHRPAIEKVAADLRRLGAQRLGVATRSPVWHHAILRAYDDQLKVASRCLGVAEHLSDLRGIDLAIERVRVEGELQAAGLVIGTRSPPVAG
nr:hypothetical protein [Micromonospora sp. DSM 115978]